MVTLAEMKTWKIYKCKYGWASELLTHEIENPGRDDWNGICLGVVDNSGYAATLDVKLEGKDEILRAVKELIDKA